MNLSDHSSEPHVPGASAYEATLHVLTHAPVPEGLEARVHTALRVAPRRTRILAWPQWTVRAAGATRAAAAAAIVFVVAGGGWGVYSHVQHRATKAIAMPAPVTAPAAGGFSSAGAMRTPQTVKGPTVVVPTPTPKTKVAKKPRAGKAASKSMPAASAGQPATEVTGK